MEGKQPCPSQPSASSHVLPNNIADPEEDVEMTDAPSNTISALDSSDAATYSEALRAATSDFFDNNNIQVGWKYSSITLRIKEFIAGARSLAHLPNGYELACEALIWFSMTVLHRSDSPFHFMLNSQRQSIYWLLDDALLYIALEWWENCDTWNVLAVMKEIRLGLNSDMIHRWEHGFYFAKTYAFLNESQKVSDVRSTVLLVAGHRLPPELTDHISAYRLWSKNLPLGDVRPRHDWKSQVGTRSLTTATYCASTSEKFSQFILRPLHPKQVPAI
jgi:hypothetical protein